MSWWMYQPRMTVGERKRETERAVAELRKDGVVVKPVEITGRTIAKSFWGKSWCDNIERYRDFAYRLERGRSYVRSGSVIHLELGDGVVDALVSGTEIYEVGIAMAPVDREHWRRLSESAAGSVGSLLELLQGKLDERVMTLMCEPQTGLFPQPIELDYVCSCPDVAKLCKHVAAVFYAIGARLDQEPELLFKLRGVDPGELVAHVSKTGRERSQGAARAIADDDDLGALFGLELDENAETAVAATPKPGRGSGAKAKTAKAKTARAAKATKAKTTKTTKPMAAKATKAKAAKAKATKTKTKAAPKAKAKSTARATSKKRAA